MCGIAGIVNLNGDGVSPVLLQAMTDALAHRGPDGEGHWIHENVGLGHRRLAIIDLSPLGHQPMVSRDSRYALTFNGMIYNHRELRAELEARGHRFRSTSDTEVVLNALIEWGPDALLRFNGMFAVGFYDSLERKLLLARDRYGIKPLYVSEQGGVFAFGSEQKAILARSSFVRRMDKSALMEYLTFQNIISERTLLQDIELLPAGTYGYLDLRATTPRLTVSRYWDFDFREESPEGTHAEYVEELDRLFTQAVNRQLLSDVELGSYLSGGMDSGSITAVAAASIPNLKTFTCGFDLSSASGMELSFDERAAAEAMSAVFKTEQYEVVLKSGDMERSISALNHHLEEPRVGQSYPNWYAASLASKFVKVVLSGAGGDELFGGYPWRYYRATNHASFEEYVDAYYGYWQRLTRPDELQAFVSPILDEVAGVSTRDVFRSVYPADPGSLDRPEDYINQSLYFEAKTFLHGLFIVEDKISMAHGLETRVPFMDNDLVDFAMRVPVKYKLNNLAEVTRLNENETGAKAEKFFQRTKDGKQILRDAMARHIPESVTGREKQGFSSPDASWFKGESIDFVRRQLNGASPIYDILDHDAVNVALESHLSGAENRRLLVWGLLSIHEWMTQTRPSA
ncbi:asparagine synthase (glutamine-hydrolyzing) [Salinibacterium sp. ZJ70]|uniref:asparagine synthase (glutamine-hydrolyzing) n=1 Tax=Salinibacterium sp. ZJ70 TaxID=2708084 RepID=UPI00141EBD3E|nr:asparagine synthase (glutamine-hydrolyzing) [Salinibacterium sp. ZJ70]